MSPPDNSKKPSLKLSKMFAHAGNCEVCGVKHMVKMRRSVKDGKLQPDACCCWHCGQRYYMQITDLTEWERKQWEQKQAMAVKR